MSEFSYFAPPVTNVIPDYPVTIQLCYKDIKSDSVLIKKTSELRSIPPGGPKTYSGETKREHYKKTQFPYVTFSGTFVKRANDQLKQHSGYICIDLDHLEDPRAIATRILEHYIPVLMFVSPGGEGLKVVFQIDITQGEHKEYYYAFENFFKVNLSLTTDPQCKDVARACFLCHDPEAFFSDTPSVFNQVFITENSTEEKRFSAAQLWVKENKHLTFETGHRNHYITELSACCHRFGLQYEFVLSKLLQYAEPDFSEREIEKTVKSIYNNKNWEPACPYIRVGVDYFKVINRQDRYGITRRDLKRWSKDALVTDHKKGYLKSIPKYDDFIMAPDNINYQPVINNCYNMFAPFCHKPTPGDWTWTGRLLEQVFGEQYELGIRYMQLLYCYPQRPTVILVLVSSQQKTGKTTFVNWISMLFGSNAAIISSADFQSMFNGHYATKNVVMIEETLFDKKITIERLKALATAKQLSVNRKNIDQFNLEYFGKIILTSNYEDKFAQVRPEETRFFVRKLGTPKYKNITIEQDLQKEIPAFLDYLKILPAPEFNDRSGFTSEELRNEFLDAVKEESKYETSKELKLELSSYFENNPGVKEIFASAKDIKTKFFYSDYRTGAAWLLRVLKEDFGMKPEKNQRYYPFNDGPQIVGRPYLFKREDFTDNETEEVPF